MLSDCPTSLDFLSTEQLTSIAWEYGKLDYLVKPHQHELWELMNQFAGRFEPETETITQAIKQKELVINISRRFGKSTLGMLLLFSLAIENPGHTYYFVAPTEQHAKDIVADIAAILLNKCPEHLRPKEKSGEFKFQNNSYVRVGGTWNGARTLRGKNGHGAFIDEAAFIPQNGPTSCLQYVISSVLSPLLLTTQGWIMLATTPPPNMKHDYVSIYHRAEIEQRLIVRTVYDNSSLTEEIISQEKIKSLRSDPSGSSWKREYLAELVPAGEDLIIPETTQQHLQITETIRPDNFEYINKYIIFDHGTTDLNAVLFGYYDYSNNKKVVESELKLPPKVTTKQIAHLIQEHRTQLWGDLPIYRAVADAISHQLIIDLNSELNQYNITFVHPSKIDLESMVNQTIIALDDQTIVIDQSCNILIDTIKSATWKVSQSGKREFARLNEIGHCDFLAALVYFNRAIIKSNPFQHLRPGGDNGFVSPHHKINTEHEALKKALSGNRSSKLTRRI